MRLGERIKIAREKCGISQADLAAAVGRSQSSVAEWETGGTDPRRNIVEKIAQTLAVNVEWLEFGDAGEDPLPYAPPANASQAIASEAFSSNDQPDGNNLGPIYASALGGDGEQTIATGDVVEHRPKPQRWVRVKGLYGFYVIGDSMSPRINAGELVWVHPHRKPSPGQEAVFIKKTKDDQPTSVMVKVFMSQSPTKWVVRQHSPKKDFELKKSEWDCQLIIDIDLNR